jgi:hypothetical protein
MDSAGTMCVIDVRCRVPGGLMDGTRLLKSWLFLGLLGSLLAGGVGCQSAQPVSMNRLINHQAMIDFSGLASLKHYENVKAEAAPPTSWKELVPKKTSFYTDMQWRAPSGNTAVGGAHVKMPLPLDAGAVVWFAKQRYSKQSEDGKLINQWVDALGRSWFEAENNKYHVRGYVVTKGFTAWIVYSGFKTQGPIDTSELALAARSMETMIPQINKRAAAAASADADSPTDN